MNKKLKIAAAAVSVVMAGTMAFGVVGCNKGNGPSGGDVTLNINIGDTNQRSISFKYGELLSGTVKLPDGKNYTSSSLKPAWAAFEEMIGYKLNDVWQNNSNKVDLASKATAVGARLQDMDIITDGAANIALHTDELLNLNEYLDKMPNYKKFLDDNPVIRLSLTSNTTDGAMYYAPYFDGNNDIEKYNLFKINWVESLLDGTATVAEANDKTYLQAQQRLDSNATLKVAIQPEMGGADWEVDVLDYQGNKIDKGLKVKYSAAKTALSDTSKGLGKAYNDAVGSAYAGTTGNIVDIMNAAISATDGAIKGSQLRAILQEYIKVVYQTADGKSFYDREHYKLSDVFCGYSAGWDVDLYAALGRVLVSTPSLLKSGSAGNSIGGTDATPWNKLYLHVARAEKMQRQSDTISMVGQLYGVRGLESKNLWTYIGNDGKVKFAPNEAETYEAMNKFHAFAEEGLLALGSTKATGSNGAQSYFDANVEALTTYDYVNTQTPAGFQIEGNSSTTWKLEEGYNYGPVITPVAKWNDSTPTTAKKPMRFTESWRTTKDTGFCVPKNVVKAGKLNAVLKFIDTMFSSEGQIVLTYGPMASSADAKDGFWYNREATAAEVQAGTYFKFGDKNLYSEVSYSGVYQPHITTDVYTAYYGKDSVNGFKFNGSGATYVGSKVGDVDTKNDTKVSKNKGVPEAVQVITRDGSFTTLAKGSIVDNECYIIEKEGAKYLVDKNGNPLDAHGVRLLQSSANQWAVNATLNYTNFARYVIGSALPIGNKLQSFEFQLTSEMGRNRALIVDKALGSPSDPTDGVISHTVNNIQSNLWYTVIPTVLPYNEMHQTVLAGVASKLHKGDNGNPFSNNGSAESNVYYDIIQSGYSADAINGSVATGKYGFKLTGEVTAASIIAEISKADVFNMTNYITVKNEAWQNSLTYYNTIKK